MKYTIDYKDSPRRVAPSATQSMVLVTFLFLSFTALAQPAKAILVEHVFEGVVTFLAPDVPGPVGTIQPFPDALGKRFIYTVRYDTNMIHLDQYYPLTPPGESPTSPTIVSSYREERQRVGPSNGLDTLSEWVNPSISLDFVLDGELIDSFAHTPGVFGFFDPASYNPAIHVLNDTFVREPYPFLERSSSGDQFDIQFVQLIDFSGTAFSDTSLPLTLDISDFDIATIWFNHQAEGQPIFTNPFRGEIDKITSTIVPEPGTALLLGLGLMGIASGGSRRQKSRKQ